jgi:hypothetical protein
MKHFHWTYRSTDGVILRDQDAYASVHAARAAALIDDRRLELVGVDTCKDSACPGLKAESAA